MKSQTRIIFGAILVLILVLTPFVSAEFWLCMEQGEVVEYCSGYKPDWTCSSSNGCEKCMSVYREEDNCYVHGSWPKCNAGPKDCVFGENHTVDGNPPEFNLISPIQDEVYTSRSVLVEFDLDEIADVYYIDNINGHGRWKRICSDCDAGSPAYSKNRNFKEGFNDITFRAADVIGNDVFVDRTFFVDSKDPRIHRTEPRRGFASGFFEVQYTEDNLKENGVIIHYGNYGDMREKTLIDCSSGKKQWCSIDFNLSDYNGERIEYYFTVEDIAGNLKKSQIKKLNVDTDPPEINNQDDDAFWTQGEGKKNKYIYFNINITEENLDEVFYTYFDSKGRLRDRRLCSRLKDGCCVKKKSFKKGHHELSLQVIDDAGNLISANELIIFDVV